MKATQTKDHTAAEVTELLSLLAVCVSESSDEDSREEATAAVEFLLRPNPEAAKQAKRQLRRALAEFSESH